MWLIFLPVGIARRLSGYVFQTNSVEMAMLFVMVA